jgi:protoheme IX farnesyltransferase
MKSAVIELDREDAVVEAQNVNLTLAQKLAAYLELTKPRITLLIVLTSAAGFSLGARHQSLNYLMLGHALIGIALLSSGIATINQFMERRLDALMRRTVARPLPSGKLSPVRACVFGASLTAAAEIYLALLVNPLTALLGLTVVAGYLFLYTPLKTRTTLSTAIGAFPGAMPPLMGWTAATGELSTGAMVLFAIVFLWQFPHFLAIAWMYREDYGRAGIMMLPVVEPEGRSTGWQIIIFTVLLVPVSLLPTLLGISGWIYFYGALALGLLFLYSSVVAARARSNHRARQLLLASVIYLPLLFALMVLDQL